MSGLTRIPWIARLFTVQGRDKRTACVDYRHRTLTDQDVRDVASNDVALFTWDALRSADLRIDEIRAINQDIKVGAYVSAHSVNTKWMPNGSAYGRDWYDTLIEYAVYRENGEPFRTSENNHLIDITQPIVIEKMIGVLKRHPVECDWIMLDFCTVPLRHLWSPGETWPLEYHRLERAFVSLVGALNEAFPDRKILPNGRLFLDDYHRSGAVDGVFLESEYLERDVAIWTQRKYRPGGFSVFADQHGSTGVEWAQKHEGAYGVVGPGEPWRLHPADMSEGGE